MAESKYITQIQENGAVMISEEVLVSIIYHAVEEVENVTLSGKPGKNWGKGIKITFLDDNQVEVVCYINVNYNQSVVSAASATQEAVTNALESMAGVKVSCVNVNVCGIIRN
jgi:uncharacterized alkaline shock family protein YloU